MKLVKIVPCDLAGLPDVRHAGPKVQARQNESRK
jgi:hypothetical protein